MSYSLNVPCEGCPKVDDCMDGRIIQRAVGAIHSSDFWGASQLIERNHYGGGHIEMTCSRKAEYEKEASQS